MSVSRKLSRNNLNLNLKLRAISRRMDSLINRTKSGQLCHRLWSMCVAADEITLLCKMNRDAEHYAGLGDFIGVFDTAVMNIFDTDSWARRVGFSTESPSPFTFKPDKNSPEEGTWEGTIADLVMCPGDALIAKSVNEAERLERWLLFGLASVSHTFKFGEDEDFLKRLGK